MEQTERHRIRHEEMFEGMTLPREYVECIPRIQALKTTEDDVIIATYPRSGTTWIGELVSCILHDGDYNTMMKRSQLERVPFLEYQDKEGLGYCGVQLAETLKGTQRFLKTHLPYKHIQKQVEEYHTRLILVVRNVRDVIVSMYHLYQHHPHLGHFSGSWDQFFQLFQEKQLLYGDWLDHLSEYWKQRHRSNVFVVFYEDAVDNLLATATSLSNFLGKNLTMESLSSLVDNFSLDVMRRNSLLILVGDKDVADEQRLALDRLAENFFREGGYGKWRKIFTQEQDNYVTENYGNHIQILNSFNFIYNVQLK